MARGTTVLKVKIYSPSGITVFSSDPLQIGEDKSDNQGFRAALAGEVAGALSHRNQFDAFEGTLSERDIIFTYVPIQGSAVPAAPVEGVFEVYQDVTVFVQQVRQQLLLLAGGDDVALGRAETGEGSLGEGKHGAVVSTCMPGRSSVAINAPGLPWRGEAGRARRARRTCPF